VISRSLPASVLYRAMGVLTAGSPCAVVLVPLAYVCAIATITRKGVIVKSASAIDALLTCKTIAVDKTGGVACLPAPQRCSTLLALLGLGSPSRTTALVAKEAQTCHPAFCQGKYCCFLRTVGSYLYTSGLKARAAGSPGMQPLHMSRWMAA